VLHQLGTTTLDGASYTGACPERSRGDLAGNRKTRTDKRLGTTLTYAYDNIYQLLTAKQGTTTKESYTGACPERYSSREAMRVSRRNPVGNRLSSVGVSPYQYNSSNELTSIPGTTYTYDNNGNTKTKTTAAGTTTYTWDFENRLTQVALPSTTGTVTFKYDPFGRRVQKAFTQGGTTITTNYLYDGMNLLEEVDNSGNVLARYTQGRNVDEPFAELRSGATSYYEGDGIGSITSLTNSVGTTANTYSYDTFGNSTASTGTVTNPFRYTGREFDNETNQYFYRARYYDASIGRFLGEDPFAGNWNYSLYSYVINNPANLKDPSGMEPEKSCECNGTAGGIRVAIKCCQDASPVSADTGSPPYDPCFSYMFVNANYMYRNGGNGAWGQIVRGCLLCAYRYGSDSSAAHAFCYASGYQRTSHWWDPSSLSGNSGFARAVAGATAGLGNQAYDYIKNRGKKPFPCLNVP
jgi:RHS repeat-associated protein